MSLESVFSLVLAAIAVAPSDRLAMADRLFNRGKWAEARTEYAALVGEQSLAGDGLLYRLAECDRALGKKAEARREYGDLLSKYPASELADRARLNRALAGTVAEQNAELPGLDSDRVPKEVRASALYHLGLNTGSTNALMRYLALSPKGRNVPYAKLRLAQILQNSPDETIVRKAVELYLDIAFGGGDYAEEALYLAAGVSYRGKRYGEADSLMRRYLNRYPKGKYTTEAAYSSAWCCYLTGRYADAVAMCGAIPSDAPAKMLDSAAYLKASAIYANRGAKESKPLFEAYLLDHPQGEYRGQAETWLARIGFQEAREEDDAAKMVECLQRVVSASKSAADRLTLAWAYEKAGRKDEALGEYLEIAKVHPNTAESADAMYRKAMMDLREERWAAADVALQSALMGKLEDRQRPEATYWRGVSAIRLGHEAEGAAFLAKALEAGLPLEESREARLLIADHDFNEGRTDAAKKAYAQLIREGAAERMSAAKILAVGKLLSGSEAKTCAKALIRKDRAEWRQCGHALLGLTEEGEGAFAAAMEAYRKCLAEKCTTEDVAKVALRLGALETRNEEWDAAEATLKRAVELNAKDSAARAEAYLHLSEVCVGKGDVVHARSYATVVAELFENTASAAAARAILKAHPESTKTKESK